MNEKSPNPKDSEHSENINVLKANEQIALDAQNSRPTDFYKEGGSEKSQEKTPYKKSSQSSNPFDLSNEKIQSKLQMGIL